MGKEFRFVNGVKFACPFCSCEVTAGETSDGEQSIIHLMPICERFDQLEPDEYLHQVNLCYGVDYFRN